MPQAAVCLEETGVAAVAAAVAQGDSSSDSSYEDQWSHWTCVQMSRLAGLDSAVPVLDRGMDSSAANESTKQWWHFKQSPTTDVAEVQLLTPTSLIAHLLKWLGLANLAMAKMPERQGLVTSRRCCQGDCPKGKVWFVPSYSQRCCRQLVCQ